MSWSRQPSFQAEFSIKNLGSRKTFQDVIVTTVAVQLTNFACSAVQSDAIPINQWQYNDELAQLCGPDVPTSAKWRRELSSLILPKAVFARPDTFRDNLTADEKIAIERADQILRQTLSLHRPATASSVSAGNSPAGKPSQAAVVHMSKL